MSPAIIGAFRSLLDEFTGFLGTRGLASFYSPRRSAPFPALRFKEIRMSSTTALDATIRLSDRDLRSMTANLEKKILIGIARRLPLWVQPDHLTALGVIAMAGASVCYRLMVLSPLALLGVNFCLFLNWFGDSLDGTLARVRDRQRP